MKTDFASQLGGRAIGSLTLCVAGTLLGIVSLAAKPSKTLATSGAQGDWAVVASPNNISGPVNNLPSAVACVSASDCWAVGYQSNGGANQTLIEQWDGSLWIIIESPNTSATENTVLNGVACVGTSDCWAVGYYSNGGVNRTLIERWNGAAWTIVPSSAGYFDVDLPLTGNPGIECRSGGGNGDYTIVFSFANTLTSVGGASVTSGSGSVSSSNIDSSDARQYVVNLTGVSNAQIITVSLTNVIDSTGHASAAVSASMAVLLGDVNGNGSVSNTDVASVKAQVAAGVTLSNFRNDVNANGVISNTDASAAKARVGTTPLPPRSREGGNGAAVAARPPVNDRQDYRNCTEKLAIARMACSTARLPRLRLPGSLRS